MPMNSIIPNDSFFELFIAVPIPLCLVSDTGDFLKVNKRFIDVFGYDMHDLRTLDDWWLTAYPDPNYRQWVIDTWQMAVQAAEIECLDITAHEYFVCCKNGKVVEMEISGTKLMNGFLATFIDVTKRNTAQRELNRIAMMDNLTKLPNRMYIESLRDRFLAKLKRDYGYGAYMMIDLDNFKQLNDTHGHCAGDLLLIEVAQRIQSELRATDVVARFGGDEFIILLESLASDISIAVSQSLGIAEKVRESLARTYCLQLSNQTIEHQCFGCIGVTIITPADHDIRLAFERADKAMYEAKKAGKNRVHLLL
jgi:diguanylate cyclase (GGDEF)-like protein/PAS domain S-box-containing protein